MGEYSCITPIEQALKIVYNILVRQGRKSFTKGSEEMENGMTNTEFRILLEMLAQLVESKAKTVEQAVEIIRQFKPE